MSSVLQLNAEIVGCSGQFVNVCFDQKFPSGPEKPFPSGSLSEADMYRQPKKHVGGDNKLSEPIL